MKSTDKILTMNVLGINYGHDSSACLIQNGELMAAVEEEKLSRKKSELGYPEKAIQYLFEKFGLTEADIDVVAFGGFSYNLYSPHDIKHRFFRKKIDRYVDLAYRIGAFLNILKQNVGEQNKAFFIEQVRQKGFKNAQILFYKHHLAHAASAYYHAPFKADLVITCDGHGDGEAFNFYLPDVHDDLSLIVENDYTTSVGQLYSCVTSFFGFKPNRHEGKIMGLAAFGKATDLVQKMNALFFYENNALKRFPNKPFEDKFQLANKERLIALRKKMSFKGLNPTGADYALNSILLADWLQKNTEGYSREDVTYALQKNTEGVVLKEIQRVLQANFKEKCVKLALAGGVFANVRLNQLLRELPNVDNIFIQPAMSDAGLSLGAAVLGERETRKKNAFYPMNDSYLGVDFSNEIPAFIENLEAKHTHLTVLKPENPAEIIAQFLMADKIVGFYAGRMEWGPRALGRRSIIANPFRKEVNTELNRRLNRTEFMPFAPSILDYKATEYLINFDENCPASDYMTLTYDVKTAYHEQLQAVVHVDGTCRPHIVKKENNAYYYAVLEAFYQKSGCGAIVNTSFNTHEEPIVATPQNALNALLEKRIDILVLENYIIMDKNEAK